MLMDFQNFEDRESTLVLLQVLALGQQEIARGEFQETELVFAELDPLDAEGTPGGTRKPS
jgi:hypothetical protein